MAKYYYLKKRENYYADEAHVLIQSMSDGYELLTILEKMRLRSLKRDGELTITESIRYSTETLAHVLNHSKEMIEKALLLFEEFGLIEVMEDGLIFMSDIQNYIGRSSDEADRKREYRCRIDTTKGGVHESGQMSRHMSGQNSDILEIELEKEKEIKNPDYIGLINLLISEIEKNDTAHFKGKDKTVILEKWYGPLRLLVEKDGRSLEQIEAVIKWCQSSDFWKSNILSTTKLRKNFPQLLLQMNQKKQKAAETEKSKYCPVCKCLLIGGLCPEGCQQGGTDVL